MHRFSTLSLMIEVDHASWVPTRRVLIDPGEYFPSRSRVILHETIHYWNQLSQGFMVRLAEEDWRRLRTYEQTGQILPSGPYRIEYSRKTDPDGLSAEDLAECLARFWELLIVGPAREVQLAVATGREERSLDPTGEVSELRLPTGELVFTDYSFKVAMRAVGNYGNTCLSLMKQLEGDWGMLLFPLLAHFALKTAKPAHYMHRFLAELATDFMKTSLEALGPPPTKKDIGSYHSKGSLRALYPIFEQSCSKLVEAEGEGPLVHGLDAFREQTFDNNIPYLLSFTMLKGVMNGLAKDGKIITSGPLEDAFYRSYAGKPLDSILLRFLDSIFAWPGDSKNLRWLTAALPPPCIQFSDKRLLPATQWSGTQHPAEILKVMEVCPYACFDIDSRWQRFVDTSRGY